MLLVICGCNEGTPGGSGVRTDTRTQGQVANKPVIGEARETFSLKPPMTSTSLKQGETKTASVAIQRGTDFDEDVKVTFSNVPNGVVVEPANSILRHGDKEMKISISAADDAALGNFTVKVTGQPSKGGPDAVNDFKLIIAAK